MIRLFTYLSAVCMLLTGIAAAQVLDAPQINCLEVQPSGDVVITWDPVDDPGGSFVAYHIYRGNSPFNPAYVEEGTVNAVNSGSFTHVTTSTLIASRCYYITAESSDGVNTFMSAPSDTLCTILLDVVPSIAPPGLASLSWNDPLVVGGAPVPGLEYIIWMENPPGNWARVDTVAYGTEDWAMEVTECGAFYDYRIELAMPSGCSFVSNIDGDFFTDVTPPDIPVVTSVSIDHSTQDAVVSWNRSSAPDTQGYILYTCSPGGTVNLLDTIPGPDSSTFTDLLAATGTGPVCYLLAAFDTCYSGVPPSPNTSPTSDICNCSSFLYPISYALCDQFVTLNWTAYTGWTGGVDRYEIFHSFEGAAPELVGTVGGGITTFDFTFSQILSGNHSFYIEPHSPEGFQARSNLRTVSIFYPLVPERTYLSSVSVTDKKEVTVTVQTQPSGTEHFYHLERKKFPDSPWEVIGTTANITSPELEFVDEDVLPAIYAYAYRVVVENVCGALVDTSNTGRPIVLEGLVNTSRLVNVLQWTSYEGWENGISAYRIYRSTAGGPEELLAEQNPTLRFYQDDVSELLFTPGDFCYRIESVEHPSSLYPDTAFTARSNELCLVQEPVIWVPSAFVVDGFNSTFRPVISFADFSAFKMIIYSRWGDVIFETEDIDSPWDGQMNGRLVQEGVYAYYISVRDGLGRPHEARGTVMMLSNRDQ